MSTDEQGNEIGKLFVGGLHQNTTNGTLKNYFLKFGEVQEASVMMDHKTGRSRGFGYVKFMDGDSVNQAMSITNHHLDGKEIDPKPCNVNMKGKSRRSLKVFVGGISPEHTEETLRDYFKQFGNLTELTLMKDPSGHRHRGFAFVGYDDEAVVKQLIADHFLTIGTKQVEIKQMEPQAGRNNMDMGMGMGMPNNKRGMNMNSMQGQWPQWASANPSAWPTAAPAAAWGGWPGQGGGGHGWAGQGQAGGAASAGGGMWDQPPSSWGAAPGGWGGGGQNGTGRQDMLGSHHGGAPGHHQQPGPTASGWETPAAAAAAAAQMWNPSGAGQGSWDQQQQWYATAGPPPSQPPPPHNDWRTATAHISNGGLSHFNSYKR